MIPGSLQIRGEPTSPTLPRVASAGTTSGFIVIQANTETGLIAEGTQKHKHSVPDRKNSQSEAINIHVVLRGGAGGPGQSPDGDVGLFPLKLVLFTAPTIRPCVYVRLL